MPITVDILMSTYNGGAFLGPQIASLQNQTFPDWRLLARDDGSTDGTECLLGEIARTDRRIEIIPSPEGNLGPARSFFGLAAQSTAPHFMFCDQDDIWFPDKIQRSLAAISRYGSRPAAVFTDLEIADVQGKTFHPSMMIHSAMDPVSGRSFERLLMQTPAMGCTMIGNAALRSTCRLSDGWPGPLYMHDWWIMLLASLIGTIEYLPVATMKWRQHGRNVSGGSQGTSLRRCFSRKRNPWRLVQLLLRRISLQARTLLEVRPDLLDPRQRRLATMAADLDGPFPPLRICSAMSHGLICHGAWRNAAMLGFCWPPVLAPDDR